MSISTPLAIPPHYGIVLPGIHRKEEQMLHETHVYDLSFIPHSEEQKAPQIVFITHVGHLEEIQQKLAFLADRYSRIAVGYMGFATSLFPIEVSSPGKFGYGKCGFVTREGDIVHLHIELKRSQLRSCTLTIHLLALTLSVPLENAHALSNRRQQLDFSTVCDPSGGMHAHSMGGRISGDVMRWLKKYAKAMPAGQYYLPLPTEVTDAMNDAWRAVSTPELKKYGSGCSALVCDDGRFILHCFGNACDVAIYPDSYSERYDDSKYGIEFSCHNLDRADQQITLLAGIAKMCELARKDE